MSHFRINNTNYVTFLSLSRFTRGKVMSYNDLEATGIVRCVKRPNQPEPADRSLKFIEFWFSHFPVGSSVIGHTTVLIGN